MVVFEAEEVPGRQMCRERAQMSYTSLNMLPLRQ